MRSFIFTIKADNGYIPLKMTVNSKNPFGCKYEGGTTIKPITIEIEAFNERDALKKAEEAIPRVNYKIISAKEKLTQPNGDYAKTQCENEEKDGGPIFSDKFQELGYGSHDPTYDD